MKFLVDANILSELTKPNPSNTVVDWLRQNEAAIAVDPIILGEIRFGIHLLPPGKKREHLEIWFLNVVQTIHCLPLQAQTGLRWAELLAELRKAGKAMPIKDSFISATALHHDLTVVTRNVYDFEKAGVRVINPFG